MSVCVNGVCIMNCLTVRQRAELPSPWHPPFAHRTQMSSSKDQPVATQVNKSQTHASRASVNRALIHTHFTCLRCPDLMWCPPDELLVLRCPRCMLLLLPPVFMPMFMPMLRFIWQHTAAGGRGTNVTHRPAWECRPGTTNVAGRDARGTHRPDGSTGPAPQQ